MAGGRRSSGGKGRYRSARMGRYVAKKHGRRSPRTTVKESMSRIPGGGSSPRARYRSATERYVSRATAERHPDTTVAESS